MEKSIQIKPIGYIHNSDHNFSIQLDKNFKEALTNITGFTHLQLIWWGHLLDSSEYRNQLIAMKPYKKGPEKIGIFATRSPMRPNPLLSSIILVEEINFEKGVIKTPYIDAEDNSPVLDIKPYHLSERVKNCNVPQWCAHWPKWLEEEASFNWQEEFNF